MTRVLVVNHDIDVSDIEVDALRKAGYEVDQCHGPIGGTACPVLNGLPCWQVELADVLVYDAWAAGTGAPDLTNDLRELHPDKPLVVTSPGPMLNWAETSGAHSVTPVAWESGGGGLAVAIEAAIWRARQQPPAAAKPQPTAGPRW
jgi:hypothetical protein